MHRVKRELSFQQAICYMRFRWVNILHTWTVNYVNRMFKNPKHITAITFSSKPNIFQEHYMQVMQIKLFLTNCMLVMEMVKGQVWNERWLLSCALDSVHRINCPCIYVTSSETQIVKGLLKWQFSFHSDIYIYVHACMEDQNVNNINDLLQQASYLWSVNNFYLQRGKIITP